MKKTTLFISSLVLSSILVFGQSSRKAAPITKATHINAIDDQRSFEVIQNAKRTPSGHIRCVTTEMEDLQREANPNLKSKEEYSEWLEQLIKNNQNNNSTNKASRNIPVVVHVIHNGDALGSGENISDAQVMSQITVLNADFSATNSDFNSTSYFNSVKTNMDIQFCLAKTDPNGQPTTGINRVNYGTASFGQSATQAMKAATQWDPTKYFNIWVVRFGGDLNGVLGYAQFPNSGAANTDGVVIGYNYFGTTGAVSAPYNKGRTATHEVGHCFGLYHIWGDESACAADDNVADTPQQKGENYGCPSYPQTTQSGGRCSTSDPSSMYMNYMDYTDDACMYMFTAGQKARVDAVLASAPRRASLLTSTVCNVAAINADFTGNPLVINEGQTVTFTSTSSSPATLNSWNWTFTGGVPGSFNGQTPPAITYSTAGTYAVSLTVTDNAAGTDTETKTAYITVNAAGTVTCDSTAAGWDWNTESFYTGAYWSADLCTGHDGYIMGNNCYDDNGWASKVTFSGSGKQITDLIYLFDQSTGTGAGRLRVWNANGTAGAPNTVLFSYPITTGQFSANLKQLILVPVSPAVPVSGNFYIGNDHNLTPLNGDTLCMAIADPTAGNQLWAKETTGWKDLSAYGTSYKGTVGAVICDIPTGVLTHTLSTTNVEVRPNPSAGIISVIMPTETTNFKVAVYNMIGEEVSSNLFTSNYAKVDLSNQPNGIYFVKVSSNGEVTTKKVILSK